MNYATGYVRVEVQETCDNFEDTQQVRGQLMGSVTSFPVLCLANYVLCRIAMEMNPKDWGLRGLLINGDDCVFEASEEAYHRWRDYGSRMGLSPSPGKVDYLVGRLQMNSRVFVPSSIDDLVYLQDNQIYSCLWRRVPVVLTGIATAQKRSSSEAVDVDLESIDYGSSLKDFLKELEGLSNEHLVRARTYFDKTFTSAVLSAYKNAMLEGWTGLRNLPFNIPNEYGGLGLPGVPSDTDLRTMKFMFLNNERLPRGASRSWKFHDILLSELESRFGPRRVIPDSEDPDYGPLYWWVFLFSKEGVVKRNEFGEVKKDLIEVMKRLDRRSWRWKDMVRRAVCSSQKEHSGIGWDEMTERASDKIGFRVFQSEVPDLGDADQSFEFFLTDSVKDRALSLFSRDEISRAFFSRQINFC